MKTVLAKTGTSAAALVAAASCVWSLGLVVRGAGGGADAQQAGAFAPPATSSRPSPPPAAPSRQDPPPATTPAPSAPSAPSTSAGPVPAPVTTTSTVPVPTSYPGVPVPPETVTLPPSLVPAPPPSGYPVPPYPTEPAPMPPTTTPPPADPTTPTTPGPAPGCVPDGLVGSLLCTVLGLLGGI